MSERNPDVTKVGEVTANPSQSVVSAGYGASNGQQLITDNVGKRSTSSTVANNGGEKDNIQWNVSPENLEDKNPFSGFSEEHLSKLDEFLSSEEAKKILQQTTEGDFTNTMSELAGSSQGMQGVDELKLDLLEGMNSHPASLDHAYCIRAPKQSLTQNITATATSKVVVVTMPTVINYSPVLPPPTAVSAETTNSIDNSSPRMSATIQLKQSEEEKPDDGKEQLHPGFIGAVHPGIVQPQHAGMPTIELGRGRGRGRRSLLPEDRLDIRRSSRISDQEQRDLAEKIRQENLQREKEAMEEMKKKEEKADTSKKTTGKRGRPPKTASDDASSPRGLKSSVIKKGEDDESEEDVSDAEDSSPSKAKSSPRISARATKGKKAKRFLEESEKSSVSPKKGMKSSTTDSEDSPVKGKKGKKMEESSSDSDSEEEEPVKMKKVKEKKKGKKDVDSDSDEEDDKVKGKKNKKGKIEQVSDSDSEEGEENLKKGKKGEKEDKSKKVLGKQKEKKGKKGKAAESDSATDTSKKGKKASKKKKEAETESDSDDSDNECLAVKAKKKETDSEESILKTPEKDQTKSKKADEVSRSPRSIFKVIGSIEQPEVEKDSVAKEQEEENSVTYEAEVCQISTPANESKSSEQEITIEFESKVEEMSYEQFLSSVGGDKEEDDSEIKAGPSGEGNKYVDSKDSEEMNKLHFSKSKRERSDSVSKSTKTKEEPTPQEQKSKKLAKKKVKKPEDIVVDPSVMDLFKPDLDTPKHAKKEVSESGSTGKEEGHTRKISTESQSSDRSKSRDHHRDKRSRSSSDHRRDSSSKKHGDRHRSHHSHHHKSSSHKLSLDSDKKSDSDKKTESEKKTEREKKTVEKKSDGDKKSEDSKTTASHVSEKSEKDSSVVQVKDNEVLKSDSALPDIESTNNLNDSKEEPCVPENVEDSKDNVEKDNVVVPMETKIENQKSENDVKSETKQEKVVRFEKEKKSIKAEIKKQEKEDLFSEREDSDDSRRFRREKSREQQKKVLDAVMKNEASEEEEEEEDQEDSDDEDEDDSDYEAPDEKYCICQQPYGKRFMICCDKCEQWFHGSCVGVSRSRGKEMEKNNEEYICPVCLGTEKMPGDKKPDGDTKQSEQNSEEKVIHKREDTAKKKERPSSGEVKFTKLQEEKRESQKHAHGSKHREDGSHPKKHLSGSSKVPDKGHSSHKHKDVRRDELHKPLKKSSNESGKHKVKDMAAQRCVVPGCNKFAKRESVYCSTDHIHKHAKDSLKYIHKQELEFGRKSADVRRVTVIEKKSGKVLSGPNAPLETILKTWLEHHPTFEVIKPRPRTTSSSKNKEKDAEQRSPREKTTTVTTILVKKEDLKEKKEPVITEKKEEKREDKRDGPDIVRLNVRKSLRDALINRAESASDMMVSDNEIRTIALHVEEELFSLFTEINHKYKAKYRSLIFNIKDSRNQGLFRKVLNGQIKPYNLVRMSPEELASKELAKWREHEAKHQLEMIVEVEKEHMKEREHIVKKTHKGEIDLDEDMSTLKDKGVEKPKEKKPDDVDSQSDLIASEPTKSLVFDTTDQHKMHLFDLNCKICTGKMAPPAEETTPTKKVKVVSHTEDKEKKKSEKPEAKKTEEEQTKAEEVVKEVLKAIKKAKAEAPKADSTVTVRSPDSALQSGLEKPKFTPSSPMLWKGFIQMQDVAKFVTTAYRVSGPADKADLPDTIHVCGRIAPEQIWDYLAKMKMVATKDIVILRFLPGGDEEKTSYINLYSYLNSRARCGVVGNKGKHIKDFYILPLASHSKIPSVLEPFDGPGLEENRPHMLLAIIVKQKHKRTSDSDRHDNKKSKVEFIKSKSSHKDGSSYTPPSSIKGKTKSHNTPKLKSILKKESPRSSKPTSSASTPSSSSTLSTPGEVTPGVLPSSQGSKDPIVQVYGEGGTLSEDSMDVPTASTSAEDIPYDPEDDSQLPYKQARPVEVNKPASTQSKVPQMVPPPDPLPNVNAGAKVPQMVPPPNPLPSTSGVKVPQMVPPLSVTSVPQTVPPLATASKTTELPSVTAKTTEVIQVDELIGKIAKSANPADATAITVAAITELKTLQEKRKFLLDLTSCVEQQKKLIEEKKSAMLTARTLVSAIYAISAASKALIPLAKAAKAESKTMQSPDVSSSNTNSSASVTSNSETSVSMVTSSVTSVTQSVTTSTSMSGVVVTDSITPHMSPQKSQSDSSIKPALSNSFSGVKEVKGTKSVSFASEVITNTISRDVRNKPGEEECFEDPCDVDLRPKYVDPTMMNVISKAEDPVYSQEYLSEKKDIPTSAPVSHGTSSTTNTSPVPPTVPTQQQQSVDPGKMPEALKSLFSVIPGSNYSHLSNIKDSKSEEKVEMESYQLSKSGNSGDGVSTKPTQSSQFNVKLLDFDYGDSDSDEDSAKQSSKKEDMEEEESTVLPYETEVKKFEEEQNQLEKEMGENISNDSETIPLQPPLPQDDISGDELPPLPAEPPPPLPEHDPEEEEDEAQKKKKKKKPPPEIVLQPTNPVGKAILEATFMKLTASHLPLPPPPLPPMPIAQGTMPPTSMPVTVVPPSAMPNVPPVMGVAPPPVGVAPPLSVGAPPVVPPGPVPLLATPNMPPMAMPGAPLVGDMMAQTPSGMPGVNTVTGAQGPVNTPKILIDSLPPVQEYVNPFRKRKRPIPKPQMEQGSIPSLFEIEVAPTKPLDENAMNDVDPADSTTGWVEDEALTLPLEDQDFRRGQDFRNEDVDERKWRRQKFPPPWAQDVDHRVGSSDSSSTMSVSSQGNHLGDNQFYGEEQGDVDYRGTHYNQPRHHENKYEYAEDQDYRSSHHYRSSHRKRRKFHSRENRKRSRWENTDDTDQRGKDKFKSDKTESIEKTDERNEDDSQDIEEESSAPVPPRPHNIAEELPLPKPPPGVVSSAPNSSTNSPVTSMNSTSLPPGVDPPMGRPPGQHPPRPPLPRNQPAPPGVDDWS